MAECGHDDCKGELAPVFVKNEETKKLDLTSYYCKRCATIWERVEQVSDTPMGVVEIGKMDERDELQRQKERYEKKFKWFEWREGKIVEYLTGEDSDLSKIIMGILSEPYDEDVLEEDDDSSSNGQAKAAPAVKKTPGKTATKTGKPPGPPKMDE